MADRVTVPQPSRKRPRLELEAGIVGEPPYVNAQTPSSALISIDNSQRITGTPTDFKVLIPEVTNGARIYVKAFSVEHLWNTITSYNNNIVVSTSSETQAYQVPIGIYNLHDLVDTLNNLTNGSKALDQFVKFEIIPFAGQYNNNTLSCIGRPSIQFEAIDDFKFETSSFFYYGESIHGLSIFVDSNRWRAPIPSDYALATNYYVTGQKYKGKGAACCIPSRIYYICSNNLYRGSDVSSSTPVSNIIAAFGLRSNDQSTMVVDTIGTPTTYKYDINFTQGDYGKTEDVDYNFANQIAVNPNETVGGSVDITIYDGYGNRAESAASNASLLILLIISKHK